MGAKREDLDENEYVVARTDEIDVGERLIVLLKGREVGVFNANGEFYAYPNWCPHMGAPLCEGPLEGTIDASFDRDSLETELSWGREGEMLTCPWHGFEFDITDGTCRSDAKFNLRGFPVRVEDDEIIVEM